jgi:hypothetical protein
MDWAGGSGKALVVQEGRECEATNLKSKQGRELCNVEVTV